MPELLDIVGQEAALAQLQKAVAGLRRPHAYIFAGPSGVGRRTTALELARLLLCEQPALRPNRGRLPELGDDFTLRQGCGQCRVCRSFAAGTSPDFQLVYKELGRFHEESAVRDQKMQDLGIGVIREFLIEPAYLAAAGGRGKVFVVLGSELMSVPAQNALLKTLEEPPPGVSIILVCADVAELLPTTRSRCQLVRFGPLPMDFVERTLAAGGMDAGEARFWAGLSEGSIGLAQQLAGEKLYTVNRKLVDDLARGADESELAETLSKEMEKLARRFKGRDEDLAASLANRQAGQMLLRLLVGIFRDALAVAAGSGRALANQDQAPAVAALAKRFDPPTLARVLAQLPRCEQLLWRNVNIKLLWANVAVTCTSAAPLEV